MNIVGWGNGQGPGNWRRFALGAGAVAALLTTAACGGDTSDGSKPSDQRTTTTSSAPVKSGPVKSTATASTKPVDSVIDLCTMTDLTFTVTNYDGPGEDIRHLMLVATNSSSKKCDVQNYPEVTLGDAKTFAPVKQGTDPGEPVTLAPGEKAYAGILTTGGHMDTYTVKSMTLTLGSPGGETPAENPVTVKMPAPSFEADDGQRITHWSPTEGLAMRPITQS
jgi:hypothetical protein